MKLDTPFFHICLKNGFINAYYYLNKYELRYNKNPTYIKYGEPASWSDAKAWIAYQEFVGRGKTFIINDTRYYLKLSDFIKSVENIEGSNDKWAAN